MSVEKIRTQFLMFRCESLDDETTAIRRKAPRRIFRAFQPKLMMPCARAEGALAERRRLGTIRSPERLRSSVVPAGSEFIGRVTYARLNETLQWLPPLTSRPPTGAVSHVQIPFIPQECAGGRLENASCPDAR